MLLFAHRNAQLPLVEKSCAHPQLPRVTQRLCARIPQDTVAGAEGLSPAPNQRREAAPPVHTQLQETQRSLIHQPIGGPSGGAGRGGGGALPELQVCVFCRNNKEAVALYTTHILKGPDGRVLCPVLRRYTCPLCGASGDNAHTIKYCPLSKMQAGAAKQQLRNARTALGKKLR
uniref:Nanos-type domain-containing protein n=1 Tax=Gopherus agassizii TaxID=38772 RepID=A0A452I1S2_9SAUR